jgi:Calx-beta domain-containing protein
VRLSKTSGSDVTVKYATADGSARAPDDYTAAGGSVTIPAGSTSRTVAVQLREDSLDEPTERFALNLSGASGATISDSSGRGSIVDDDAAPTLAIRDTGVREGAIAGFLVALSRPSGRNVTVRWATEPGTARAGSDFATASGTLTIPAGQASGAVFVQALQDRLDEPNETFRVRLSSARNAGISDSLGQATILDDDPKPNARPRLSALRLRPFAFRAASRGGPTGRQGGAFVSYLLSEPALVTFRAERLRRDGRWATVPGVFRRTAHAGRNTLRFRGRIGGRRLAAGRYRLVVRARDSGGATSLARRAGLRIVP